MKFIIVVSVLVLRSFYKPEWIGQFRERIIDLVNPLMESFMGIGIEARFKLALLLLPLTLSILYIEVMLFKGPGLLIYAPLAMAFLWLTLSEKRIISHLEEYLEILRSNTPDHIDALAEKLEIEFEDSDSVHEEIVQYSYAASLTYLFNNLFWFATCGITGLTVYQMVRISQSHFSGRDVEFDHLVDLLYFVMEWPVARLLSLCFAFLGSFSAVSQPLGSYLLDASVPGIKIVKDCGNAAIRSELPMDLDSMPPKMAAIETIQLLVNLLRRSLITWATAMGVLAIALS